MPQTRRPMEIASHRSQLAHQKSVMDAATSEMSVMQFFESGRGGPLDECLDDEGDDADRDHGAR